MKEQKQVNPYPVRMPAEVKDWMSIQAKAAGRSLNSEIVRVLTERMNRSIGRAKSA
ncbi:Arc family DNA-binding protein [Serratia ureilytica]|nr:Arc family DNA-binding protein [Serratia marcescens]PKR41237.1 DNA-binding protein [Serratia ureilytica]PYA07329.1 DNA-binding protein [Serratia marcescens]QQU64047.1 Arc family DNA-binding protein [Serratia ureilytica]HEP0388806.1 Arc family DNA-binding protein [Serratia marcescens]